MDGKHPVSTPLTVLSADNPPAARLNWTVREYIGSKVFKAKPGVEVKSLEDIDTDAPLKNREDLKAGDTIYVPSFHGGPFPVQVKVSETGELYAETSGLVIVLAFAEDDRQCWTTAGYINKRGIVKSTKQT